MRVKNQLKRNELGKRCITVNLSFCLFTLSLFKEHVTKLIHWLSVVMKNTGVLLLIENYSFRRHYPMLISYILYSRLITK